MPINPDRIRILDKADRRPAVDIFDKDPEGPVVDLGIDLDRYFGHVFIKVKHFEFIAREFLGMVSKEEHNLILGLERDEHEKYLKAQSALEELQEERQEIFNGKLTKFLANYAGGSPATIRLGSTGKDTSPVVATGGLVEVKPGTDSKAKSTKEIDLDNL